MEVHDNALNLTSEPWSTPGEVTPARELELRMASSRDGVAASWFRNSEEGKCGKDRDFEFRLFWLCTILTAVKFFVSNQIFLPFCHLVMQVKVSKVMVNSFISSITVSVKRNISNSICINLIDLCTLCRVCLSYFLYNKFIAWLNIFRFWLNIRYILKGSLFSCINLFYLLVLRFNHILCFCNSFLRQIQCNFFFWQYIFFSTCSTV